jgi:hypothetical protein
MGHFVQENLPDGSPGVVQNKFAAQGDLPPVSRPVGPSPIQIPKREERRAQMLPVGGIQDPDRPFPFAGQAVENTPLQFFLAENLSAGIISHFIKISFLLLKDQTESGDCKGDRPVAPTEFREKPSRKKRYFLAEPAELAELAEKESPGDK